MIMKSAEIKEYIHQNIDKLDSRFLQAMYAMMQSYISDENSIVGYRVDGEPISKRELKSSVLEAEKRIEAGEYTTQEDLEKESETW